MLVKSVDPVSWTHILPRDSQLSQLALEKFVALLLGLFVCLLRFFPSLLKSGFYIGFSKGTLPCLARLKSE